VGPPPLEVFVVADFVSEIFASATRASSCRRANFAAFLARLIVVAASSTPL